MLFLDPARKTPLGDFATVDIPDSWPGPNLLARPRDTLGERIVAYAALHRDDPRLPPSPWSVRHGDFYFPDDLNEVEPATDEAPVYRTKAFASIGGVVHTAGTTLRFDGWLNRPGSNHLMSILEPQNTTAERIYSYTLKYLHGRQLDGQPYSGGLLRLVNPALFDSSAVRVA